MMKKKKKAPFHLAVLMTVLVFLILVVTMALVTGVTYGLLRLGVLHILPSSHVAMTFVLVQFGLASIFVGTAIAFLVLRVLLKPLNKMIEAMNQLARGDYKTRLYLGEHRLGKELAGSFNKLADELDNTELLRSDFVNNFSHEFKTPIVSIYGFARLLRRGHLDEEQTREYLAIIEQESGRLADMATNVLNMTKVENQNILTDVREYNLSEQLRRSILLLEKKWSAKKIQLCCEFNEHTLCANEEMMQQVWVNLLDNAIKFAPESGTITIIIREYAIGKNQQERWVAVAVKNNGPAIKEEDRSRIFNKFYQSDVSHSEKGTGIGLAVVKKIVELHSGTIRVESGSRETAFWVEVPKEQKK